MKPQPKKAKQRVDEFLRRNGLDRLVERTAVKVSRHKQFENLVLLKYDMINSPMADPLAQQCRGIILDESDDWKVVSYPYNKFFNHGEGHAADIDWNTARVYEKLDGCFPYNTPLNLWDGGSVKIGDVVSKNLDPTLIGRDKNGALVPCSITSKFANGTKDHWIELELTHYPVFGMGGCGGSPNIMRVTPNHEIWVNGEFRPAGAIQVGDTVLTYQATPDAQCLHYVRSSLLGDGSICWNNVNCNYQEGHTSTAKELTDYAVTCLGNVGSYGADTTSGFGSTILWAYGATFPAFTELREEWYPEGEKIVPNDLSWMDDFSAAKWFLDDGSLAHNKTQYQRDRALFATNGFKEEDVRRLGEKLNEMYGISYTVYFSKGWNLRVNAGRNNEISKFWEGISPHIIPAMRYKLPKEYREVPFTPFESGKRVNVPIESKVVSTRRLSAIPGNGKHNKKLFPSGRKGFDIETSTHNYFAKGTLVHNSICTLYHYRNEWHVATNGSPDAGGPVPYNREKTFKMLFWQTFQELGYNLPKDKNMCYMFELMSPENRVVVPHKSNQLVLHGARYVTERMRYAEVPPEFAAGENGWKVVKTYPLNDLQGVLTMAESLNGIENEGFVVCDRQFNRQKIKVKSYVALHHMKSALSLRRMMEIVQSNEGSEFLRYFPEYHDEYWSMKDKFRLLCERAEEEYLKYKDIEVQKDFALAVKDLPYSAAFFSTRSGKTADVSTWFHNHDPKKILRLLGMKDEEQAMFRELEEL